MKLEDYFEFLNPDDIRIKGHRIGIDDVIAYYWKGYTPEKIQTELPTLSLEKIYATITYYLHDQDEIDAYMSRLAAWREQRYQEWLASEPSPVVKRIRQIKAQKEENITK
ncbi:MAG: DUF433 domain-containing protein [Okeania sp. SIO3I5]|uniref:DUF433 domain-containing protein n=1 Tax=Okeania sp. SIO3I5 TaxID=2607805 RepID=UPI0013BAC14E|nr:DUF433 domain-containing protein [Okeania sp. SIO3I5]NEQ38640.1 DUF433 domain-containing protein [Okeania sp. SIO3I5]